MAKLSEGQRLKIQRLRSHGVEWDSIATQIGCSAQVAADSADLHYSPKHRRMMPKPKKRLSFTEQYGDPLTPWLKEPLLKVPDEVLAERDRIAAHTPTRHETLLGDPPIWRSALAKKQAGA